MATFFFPLECCSGSEDLPIIYQARKGDNEKWRANSRRRRQEGARKRGERSLTTLNRPLQESDSP